MVGLWRGARSKVLGQLGWCPSPNQERVLYPARRSPFIGPGRSSFGPSFCPEHRGVATVRPFALLQSYDAGVSYVEVCRPVVSMYIRNLGTHRAMSTPPAVPILLDWGYASA
jgi:hypothetical protein